MGSKLQKLKQEAFKNPEVQREYDALSEVVWKRPVVISVGRPLKSMLMLAVLRSPWVFKTGKGKDTLIAEKGGKVWIRRTNH